MVSPCSPQLHEEDTDCILVANARVEGLTTDLHMSTQGSLDPVSKANQLQPETNTSPA